MLICPKCKNILKLSGRVFRCDEGHCFDQSKAGYVNLVLNGNAQSGDDKAMVRARSNFLNHGYYQILVDELVKLSILYKSEIIVDAGCGEGYYTNQIAKENPETTIYGFDLSKAALNHASKNTNKVQYALASLFHLPIMDETCDLLFNVFAPCAYQEFCRVLKSNGHLVEVKPGPNHLMEMKSLLYEDVYENEVELDLYEGFTCEQYIIKDGVEIRSKEDIKALFSMTPYYWKTSAEAKEKLYQLNTLKIQVEFLIRIHTKV